MPYARKSVVHPGLPGVYHCISRCVRRAWICGIDLLTQKNYEHRRAWIYERIQQLSAIFAIEVFACTVLSNHYHIVLRVNPDEAQTWSDEEVVRRWDRIYSVRKAMTGMKGELDEEIMSMVLERPELIAEWRSRLCSISWFMKQINEPLARSANKEDGCKGRFWEGRYKCQHLADESAVLACMAYVDLNPIRAGMAETPEASEYTSIQDRIVSSQASGHRSGQQSESHIQDSEQIQESRDNIDSPAHQRADWLTPVDAIRVGDEQQGWLLTLEEYLKLVDETGRCMKEGKRGVIPKELAPILTRMKLQESNWLQATQHFGNRFYRVCGHVHRMMDAAKRAGQSWFQGMRFSKEVFQN
jgi:putative transposase